MTVDGSELYGWRWPPGCEPMRVPGSTETLKGRGPAAGLSTPDPIQGLAERVAEKFWENFNKSTPQYHLATLIASELRAGGWRVRCGTE